MISWFLAAAAFGTFLWIVMDSLLSHSCARRLDDDSFDRRLKDVILIKVGGSSITDKAHRETLRPEALQWLSETLASALDARSFSEANQTETCAANQMKGKIILVHGAGSFGHHSAKEYQLKGQSTEPLDDTNTTISNVDQQKLMHGVAKTRLSVQTLNRHVVASLIDHGIPAVGISPCFGIPHMQAHGGKEGMAHLVNVLQDTLQAGLLPVLHGDACLYGSGGQAGILGGDTLMEGLGLILSFERAVFVTDVDGVFTADPRTHSDAELLRSIHVDRVTGELLTEVSASGSSHAHDVTGGLKAKLGAAASIAMMGTDVVIVKCESKGAERAIRGDEDFGVGTLIQGVENVHGMET